MRYQSVIGALLLAFTILAAHAQPMGGTQPDVQWIKVWPCWGIGGGFARDGMPCEDAHDKDARAYISGLFPTYNILEVLEKKQQISTNVSVDVYEVLIIQTGRRKK